MVMESDTRTLHNMPVAYKPNPRSHTVVVGRSAVGRPDYICDGTDDHVQIQAAIDSLGTDGGRVLIRKGNYQIGTTLTIDTSDIIIQGEGFDTILKAKSSLNDYIITFDSSSAAAPVSSTYVNSYYGGGGYF